MHIEYPSALPLIIALCRLCSVQSEYPNAFALMELCDWQPVQTDLSNTRALKTVTHFLVL